MLMFALSTAQGEEVSVPEEVGRRAAHMLLEEVQRGGVVDSTHQVSAHVRRSVGSSNRGASPKIGSLARTDSLRPSRGASMLNAYGFVAYKLFQAMCSTCRYSPFAAGACCCSASVAQHKQHTQGRAHCIVIL